MAPIPTLAELAATEGDKQPTLKHPLGEGALANVAETMRLLNAAGKRIDAAQGALQACRVPFDPQPFRTLQQCLGDAWQALQPAMLAHLDAIDAQKGRAS